MQARRISYLRCAAYLRPLPRTHQQQKQLLAQTHSRGRAMLAPITEIRLPPCLGVYAHILFYLRRGTAYHACIHFFELINTMLHAQIYTEKRKSERHWLFTPPLTIYKKNCYRSITDGEKLKNSFIFPSLTTV